MTVYLGNNIGFSYAAFEQSKMVDRKRRTNQKQLT